MLLKSTNCTFLNELHINSLRKLNILTVEQLISHADLEALSRNSKIPLEKLKLEYKFFVGQHAALPQNGCELLDKYLKTVFILKTGCASIDGLLHGGIYSSELTEIYGESNSGKTRLCLNIAANLLVSIKSTLDNEEINNTDFRILYIDSCNNFCEKLFVKILSAMDQSLTETVKNQLLHSMSVIKCENAFDLLDILFRIEKHLKTNSKQTRPSCNKQLETKYLTIKHLIIIENFNIMFNNLRNCYNNEFLSYLHYTTWRLKYLCTYLNISIIVVNTTTAQRYTFPQSWNSLPNVRILLSKNNDEHNAELVKHTRIMSNVFCKFEITKDGLK